MVNISDKIAGFQIKQSNVVREIAPQTSQTSAPSVNSAPPASSQERNLYDAGALLRHRLSKTFSPNAASNPAMTIASPETGSAQSVVLTAQQQSDFAARYAPIFYLAPGEEFEPGDPVAAIEGDDPNTFADNAVVDGRRVTVQGTPTTDEAGDLVVLDAEGNVMRDEAGNPLIHVTQLTDEQYMEFQGELGGDAENAPVFYQHDPGDPNAVPPRPASTTYWLFSPNNHYAGPAGMDADHQGDWERVTVVFGNGVENEPTEVRYSGHSGSRSLPWSEVPRDASGRPIVFVARGTHAMSPYPWSVQTAGGADVDYFGVGTRIDPLEDDDPNAAPRLRNVEEEQWWGTRGHWGLKSDEGADDWLGLDDGPQGPMPDPDGAGGKDGKGALGASDPPPFIYTGAGVLALFEEIRDIANQSDGNSADTDALGATIIGTLARYNSGPADDDEISDFIVRGIVGQLEGEELKELSSTETGRAALRAMAFELLDGSISEDEKEIYERIYRALGSDVGNLPPPEQIQVLEE